MVCTGWRLGKQITHVLCPNVVSETKVLSLAQKHNYLRLRHSIMCHLVMKWSRHFSYLLENIKCHWGYSWEKSPKVKATPGCWTCKQEQQHSLWQKSKSVMVLAWCLLIQQDTKADDNWSMLLGSIVTNSLIRPFLHRCLSPLCPSMQRYI